MKAEQEQLFRDTILRVTRAFPRGMNIDSLDISLRAAGFRNFERQELELHLQYLQDKNFLALADKAHTPANRLWRVTAAGIDYLAESGF